MIYFSIFHYIPSQPTQFFKFLALILFENLHFPFVCQRVIILQVEIIQGKVEIIQGKPKMRVSNFSIRNS